LEDKLSLDIGGRYQDASKFATVEGYAASWIFTECPESPCDPSLTPVSVVFDPALEDYEGCEGEIDGDRYCLVEPTTARMFVSVPDGALLYAMPYRETRDVPQAWWSGNAIPVGLTAPDFAIREDRGEGPYAVPFDEEGFSPQITLRYRPTDSMTLYARYAEATKIGGFDTGQTSIPQDIDELTFDTEEAEQIEIGIKGFMFDSRVSYSADLFELDMPNLQTTVLSPDPEQDTASSNAAQRVRGLEFDLRWAATDNLLLGLGGIFMDGEMTSFSGAGCTDSEIQDALNNPDVPCQLYDEDGNRVQPPPPIDPADAFDDLAAIIDRTGDKAPRTPDWKFVFSADYSLPFAGSYEFSLSAKGYVSDGYILDVNGFSDIVDYDRHEDLSILASVGNIDQGWLFSLYARNILEARPTYHAENDVYPNGLQSVHLSPSSFATYGVRFEYSFGQ
jgi:outer membrane receptor protein involved in Fe transport